MLGKIILEEHVDMPEDNSLAGLKFFARQPEELANALHDIHGERLREMNANGVEMAVISQDPPGPQGIRDPEASHEYAIRSNDYIAKLVDRAPARFAAFAAVSMHDPALAAAELSRCVKDLNMVGVMLHNAQEVVRDGRVFEQFYDDPVYDAFWDVAQSLDVPVYLHPKMPLPQKKSELYASRPYLLGPTFSFTSDTSFHALALITSGVFDRFPRLKLVLGHMGEMIIGQIGRIDHWLEKAHRGRSLPAKRTLRYYFENNITITTAGYFCTTPLLSAMTEIGASRILFSIDTPYENITEGSTWLKTLPISQGDIVKIGRTNALDILPRLKARMRTAEVDELQQNRDRDLWLPQAGFRGDSRLQTLYPSWPTNIEGQPIHLR